MLIDWSRIRDYYGRGVDRHRRRFESATQTTYGMLCFRGPNSATHVGKSDGDHAEETLLRSTLWTIDVPAVLQQWTLLNTPMSTTVVLNRSPCAACAALLVEHAQALEKRFPVVFRRNRFVLACRGVYEDAAMDTRTTQLDIRKLRDAGWETCVLAIDGEITARGRILLEFLGRTFGRPVVTDLNDAPI